MDWSALDVIPHLAQLPEESACLWRALLLRKGVFAASTIHEWKSLLDAAPRTIAPTLFVNLPHTEFFHLRQVYGFPLMHVPILPKEPDLSRLLASAVAMPIPNLLRQSQIASEITRNVQGTQLVVLLVLDGLAYEDVLEWKYPGNWSWARRPCIVDGITLTTTGMPRVIGHPPLAHQLFQLGYKQHLGFTYWERNNNDLTDTLFAEFSKGQITRVSEFAQVLDRLADSEFDSPTYVQIVRSGLDQFVHRYRERPNIRGFLRELEFAVQDLLELLTSFQCSVRVYITADHGILWYDHQNVVAVAENLPSARYFTNDTHVTFDGFIRICETSGCYMVTVGPDHICRHRHANEWGFHGGISGRESLIPFLALEYRP
jgi:hypothetical protein